MNASATVTATAVTSEVDSSAGALETTQNDRPKVFNRETGRARRSAEDILARESQMMGREATHEGSAVVDSCDGHRLTLVVYRMEPLIAGPRGSERNLIERRWCVYQDGQPQTSGIVSTEWITSAQAALPPPESAPNTAPSNLAGSKNIPPGGGLSD